MQICNQYRNTQSRAHWGGFPSLLLAPMAGLVSIRFAVALLGTISAVAADDDCGAAGWTVPNPPAGATLLQVQAIIR